MAAAQRRAPRRGVLETRSELIANFLDLLLDLLLLGNEQLEAMQRGEELEERNWSRRSSSKRSRTGTISS